MTNLVVNNLNIFKEGDLVKSLKNVLFIDGTRHTVNMLCTVTEDSISYYNVNSKDYALVRACRDIDKPLTYAKERENLAVDNTIKFLESKITEVSGFFICLTEREKLLSENYKRSKQFVDDLTIAIKILNSSKL